jgi:adenine phosphoribosyltransferase
MANPFRINMFFLRIPCDHLRIARPRTLAFGDSSATVAPLEKAWSMDMERLKRLIRSIPDFPKAGIEFKDISPLLADGDGFQEAIDELKYRHAVSRIDMVVGIEARGFVFAAALAYALRAGTCMVRKPGKLPHTVHRQTYELEYGSDTVEIHTDALDTNQRILIVDDVLATGGTVLAAAELIERNFEVEIVEIDFLMELMALNGREKLHKWPVHSLLQY